jgi:hypothetical protein
MNPFVDPISNPATSATTATAATGAARLKVALAGHFCYEMLLNKSDGHSLSVGSSSDNAIVIPQAQVADHQLEIFFAQGKVWVENSSPSRLGSTTSVAAVGIHTIGPGAELEVGDARITLLEV